MESMASSARVDLLLALECLDNSKHAMARELLEQAKVKALVAIAEALSADVAQARIREAKERYERSLADE